MSDDDSFSGRLFLFLSIPVRHILLMLSGLKQTPSFLDSSFCNLAGLSREGLSLYHMASQLDHSHWQDVTGCCWLRAQPGLLFEGLSSFPCGLLLVVAWVS